MVRFLRLGAVGVRGVYGGQEDSYGCGANVQREVGYREDPTLQMSKSILLQAFYTPFNASGGVLWHC